MIVLRELTSADASRLTDCLNHPDVTRFLSTRIPQPYRLEDAVWWIEEGSRLGLTRAIEHDGVMVGSVGANRGQFERSRSAEVGYWIAAPYWGRGIASEALKQLTRFVFATTDIVRLQAYVFDGNHASMRVLEKNGYRLEGVLGTAVFKDGRFFNEHLYARIREGRRC